MDSSDLLSALIRTTLSSSVAMLLVLWLRRPVRYRLGASAAYLLWLVVPAAWLAVLLPPAEMPFVERTAVSVLAPLAMVMRPDDGTSAGNFWWGLTWVAGATAMAVFLVRQQSRFVRGLGPLTRRPDGLWSAQTTRGLPAAMGVLRTKIVVPEDFNQRYTSEEQALMLLHERVHLQRGDILLNAAWALMRCVYWFNPVLAMALRRFREDQEFSCDERVIAAHDGARRSYGSAMLKAALALSPLPVGCHWQDHHPLKERIAMLKRQVPGRRERWQMSVLAGGLSLAVGYAAWAAQPAVSEEASASTSLPAHVVESSRHMAPPSYPKAAFEQGLSGKVVLEIDVAADGSVSDLKVVQSVPQGVFDQAVITAAQQWHFTPAQEGGKAIAGKVRVPVWFDLNEDAVHDEASGG